VSAYETAERSACTVAGDNISSAPIIAAWLIENCSISIDATSNLQIHFIPANFI
jgi:hypothetical protein